MSDPDSQSAEKVDDDFIKLQYEQAFDYLQTHDDLIWQTPSVAAAVNSGILYIAFQLVDQPEIRSALLLMAIFLTSSLTVALIKHRYFMIVESETIREIEKHFNSPSIQRKTTPETKTAYWSETKPTDFLQTRSASRWLIRGMILSLFVLISLLVYTIQNIF
ncbi:hypothetical protein KTS45_12460 [Halomicroarcula limicola]|uniref:Uncharacterized protein n=1 Tax=Haloarcula limicola TaxID=1429915 RepID=A0A8J7YBU1_9EURY|nr:hypothetical protein [Halomicroarcula limicola]MBV0925009.1 hypothetical protein [Halomicroarcula limicola]